MMQMSKWLFYIETEQDTIHYLDAQGFIINRSDALPWEGANGEAMWESNRRADAFSSRVNNPPVAAVVAERIGHCPAFTPKQPTQSDAGRAHLEANNPRLMTRSYGEHARIERQIRTIKRQLEVAQ